MTLRESSANYFRPLAQCVYTRKILETICEHIRWYQSGTAAWFRIERCISLLPSAFLPLPLYLSCSLSIYLSSHLSLSLDICDLVVKLSGWRNKVSKECKDGAFNREYCLWETIALPHPRLDVSSFDVGYPPPPLLLQPDNPRAFVMPWPPTYDTIRPQIHPTCMWYAWTTTWLRARTADSSRHACAIPSPRNFAAATLNYVRDWCATDALLLFPSWVEK